MEPQQPHWTLYQALDEAYRQTIDNAPGEGRLQETYVHTIRRTIQAAHQLPPEGTVVQGKTSRTGNWMALAKRQHTQEALDHIQESEDPPPLTHQEVVAGLILTLPRRHKASLAPTPP